MTYPKSFGKLQNTKAPTSTTNDHPLVHYVSASKCPVGENWIGIRLPANHVLYHVNQIPYIGPFDFKTFSSFSSKLVARIELADDVNVCFSFSSTQTEAQKN